ncbi:DNA polymerase IV [Actinomyces faecalis]|uniref:DNA polymerase IV n=1 Tax=Actinomyces faecalis TaxID=2722820 RepID=UPI001553E17D|nr:DNA polymerase IV [Actinomyces faecalis]
MSRAPRNEAARRSWGEDDSATPILHVDMDAFYASVELLEHPELVGCPVVVGGTDGRGVVSAASYEARAYGVSSAMSMSQALRRCPQAVVLPVRHAHYSRVSRQVMSILEQVTPVLEKVSVDEAFLDVSGARRRMGSPVVIGRWIRSQVRSQLGLPASVGIAATKFVAKLASSHAKPDGLLLVPAGATQDFLDVLPVGAMWGVGDKSAQALARWGITDVRTLAATDVRRLERILGTAAGRHLWDLAHGIDPRPVTVGREEKSVGTESTFFDTLTSREDARRVLLDQSHQCAERLRDSGTRARVVVLKARGADFTTLTRSRTLSAPTDLARDVFAVVESLFAGLPVPPGGYRLLGVRCEGLVRGDDGVQLALDEDPRRGASERAADAVRRRWGAAVVGPASLLPGRSQTRSRTQPPGPEEPRSRHRS